MNAIEKMFYDSYCYDYASVRDAGVEEAYHSLCEKLESLLGTKTMLELETDINEVAGEHERSGFVAGFKYATALWRDCQ